MSSENARAFEEKLLTIDLVDGLRREQERLDAALDNSERMLELRNEIQAYYSQAGIVVSDALIDKAIAERQQQRFAFKAPKLGAGGHLLARGWIYRGRLTIAVSAAVVSTLGVQFIDRQLASRAEQQQLAAYRSELQQQLDELASAQQRAAALPAALDAIVQPQDVAPIAALPGWVLDLQSSYQQARLDLQGASACNALQLPAELPLGWEGEAQVDSCHAALPAASTALATAQRLRDEHQQLDTAVTRYGLLQQRVAANPALNDWRAVAGTLSAAAAATAPGNTYQSFTAAVGAAGNAVDTVASVAPAHSSAIACLTAAIAEADSQDAQQLGSMRDEGVAFTQGNDIRGVVNWSTQANDTCAFFGAALNLRMVSEAGEQTGVWRYYDGNRNGRSFFLVVDALSATGAKVDVSFVSAEDQLRHKQSRFAVQVVERIYNRVRDDKLDDGLLRDSDAGSKPANSLRWDLPDGYQPNFIAEW